MVPSNQPSLSGRNSSNRRRSNASNSTSPYPHDAPQLHHPPLSHSYNAIAAAEAAASSILSDAPLPKNLIRSRSIIGSGNGLQLNNIADQSGSSPNTSGSSNGIEASESYSLLASLRQQQAILIQKQYRKEKVFSFKKFEMLLVLIVIFAIGVFMIEDEQRHKQYSRGKGKRVVNPTQNEKLSVPLPPNMERNSGVMGKENEIHAAAVPTTSLSRPDLRSRATTGQQANRHIHSKPDDADGVETSSRRKIITNEYSDSRSPSLKKNMAASDNVPGANLIPHEPKHMDPLALNSSLTDHHHAIPPVLIFTYHTNLLTTPESDLVDEEDAALSRNVRKIVSLHPNAQIRFLDDNDCLQSIRVALGQDTPLATFFSNETRGMYKADICRGAALYETGGLYFDIDIDARMTLWEVIFKDTTFVTTLVHKDSNHHGGFFQAFIGTTPRHLILKRYLEMFVKYYQNELVVNGPLGVILLRLAYDDVSKEQKKHSELWQEVRYHPQLFPDVVAPTGKRRACQMVVVALRKKQEDETKMVVPFYSHAAGSRMCGGKDTNKKG